MNRSALRATVLAATFLSVLPARADFETGQQAWDAGRTEEALGQWQAAVASGDRRAMHALGRLYLQGLGVLQDYVEAHKWLNLAASRGEAAALAERDTLAEKMTPAQVAQAQALARAWRPSEGQGAAASDETTTPPPVPAATDSAQASETASSAAKPAARADSTATPAPTPKAGPPPPRALREAQALLAALGYRPGPADGLWGTRTASAYRAFLDDAGLPAAKTLTPEALRALRAAVKRRGGGTEAGVAAAPSRPPVRPDALHRAAKAGDVDGLKAALAAGVDVNARDGRGRTALMNAVNKGYTLLVPLLLDAKADPDVRAADGATALFMAAVHGHSEIIALLMKAGADIEIKGPKGKTPVEVARKRYGGVGAAKENGESLAVLTLLEGRTLAEVETEARAREDDSAFGLAKSQATVKALDEYLGSYAKGRHAAEARRLLEEAKEKERLAREWLQTRKLHDCPECPEMVKIPAGAYKMGSFNEGPIHYVKIRKTIAVGIHEVTRGEWAKFVSETEYSSGISCDTYEGGEWKKRTGRNWRNPGYAQSDAHPVVCVSWEDAREYVEWLSKKTNEEYRLPSESEWEYAARGGTSTPRHWGYSLSDTCGYANVADGSAAGELAGWAVHPCRDGVVHTSEVGSYAENAFGLRDTIGNVWEWTEDCWNDDYHGAPSDDSAWTYAGNCGKRTIRGGSWRSPMKNSSSASRAWAGTDYRGDGVGFRVARTLE